MSRDLEDLINEEDSAWPLVQEWLSAAHVRVLPVDKERGCAELLRLQVTTRSPMGCIAFQTGGITTHGGLLRILGAGCDAMPRSISQWSAAKFPGPEGAPPPALWIADDVFGGVFALNGGAISGVQVGNVAYLCPSGLQWDDLELSYSQFIQFAGSVQVVPFYDRVLWLGWEADVRSVEPHQCISFYPPLFAKCDDGHRSRKAVPCEEVFDLLEATAKECCAGP